MGIWVSDGWIDYELIDCTFGERLERWGDHFLIRPDPQVIWKTSKSKELWGRAEARYVRSSSGGGKWNENLLPDSWEIEYGDLKFGISLMNFKHTGVFPEQGVNWEYISGKIKESGRKIRVLNLFAYTGGATLACLRAGASVCHVDASRGMVSRARSNAELSGLADRPVRWIVDDCVKFVEREIRRGNRYDAIIMDPPSYGRGPGGETWKLEDNFYEFLDMCGKVLSSSPLFVLINSYTTGLAPGTLSYIAESVLGGKHRGHAESCELGLRAARSGLVLPCGATCRWEA